MSEAGRGNPSPTVRLPHLNTPSVKPGRDGGRNGERRKTSEGRGMKKQSRERGRREGEKAKGTKEGRKEMEE